ncbi:hypothetical protein [Pseudomonas matsuisoli]|uniref:Uncharacterized protein n=1 Tax=Pseudomonas matsuisoli TaxID=1515666 RepID=A0A917PU61_9PSED|nr:hypothetical protein [Pseudomonas matsuisoli]GGJ91786.1 hypothetical protein GCM10009304_16980 [Pseudomonas matsuisoli]
MSDKDEREQNRNAERKDADLAKKGGNPGPSGYGGMEDQDQTRQQRPEKQDRS